MRRRINTISYFEAKMKVNEGKADRTIRAILSIISIYFAITFSPWIYILTAILLGTAIAGRCGLYKLFGINTCKLKK